LCNNVANLAYSWAFDKTAQAIDRCYRLNSEKDLNCYPILCEGTIGRRMEAMTDEKSDASELVLNGHLLGETPEEVNLAYLLRSAALEFKNGAQTVDEESLELEWPALKEELRAAFARWEAKPVEQEKAESAEDSSPAPLPKLAPVKISSPKAGDRIIPFPSPPSPVLQPWREHLESRRNIIQLAHC
jgi:hypothetical protein